MRYGCLMSALRRTVPLHLQNRRRLLWEPPEGW